MDYSEMNAATPVVIDNGSGVLKAGMAGEQIPKCIFSSYLGRPKHTQVMTGGLAGEVFMGPKAKECRGLMNIRYPIEHGVVTNWNDMERLWSYVYSKEQLGVPPEEHPVLLTEAPLNPRRNREKAAEVFFEAFGTPALFFSMQAVLGLYASGRTTGVVIDSGDGVTHAVPVYEGFAMKHSIQRVDVAGRDITRYLKLLLRREGLNFKTSAEFEIVRTIKEQACYVTANPSKEEQLEMDRSSDKGHYILPDGQQVSIGASRFRAPEVLFNPSLIGEESPGIHEVLMYSIQKSDMDLRKTLYSHVVMSGGSTLFKGFGERLLAEVTKLAPKNTKIKIAAPPERKYTTWLGGSILASLTTFNTTMCTTKQKFEEEGPHVIHDQMFVVDL